MNKTVQQSRYKWAIILLLGSALATPGLAQVPHDLEFADLDIHFSHHARQEIGAKMKQLRSSPRALAIKVARARQYFPLIEEALESEGVPLDFKYLSLQESALISDAVSSSQAVGFWQFKDFTALEVGLRLDDKVDARKHIIASTRGAARYLKQNNFFFDNWMYALTAYYTGRGGAEKYVRTKYMGKKQMRVSHHEHWYIKTFIAHLLVFKEAMQELEDASSLPHLLAYYEASDQHLLDVASSFQVSESELKKYNKWLHRGRIPAAEDLPIIIPLSEPDAPEYIAEYNAKRRKKRHTTTAQTKRNVTPRTQPSASDLDENLTNIKKYIEGRFFHQFKINGLYAIISHKHDNLNTLSIKGELSEKKLIRYNDLDEDHQIKSGQIYYLQKKRSRASTYFHVAKPGETLWNVAQRYGIRRRSLAYKNRMDTDEDLKAGHVLWLKRRRPQNEPIEYRDLSYTKEDPKPKKSTQPRSSATRAENHDLDKEINKTADELLQHITKEGESLYEIAKQYGISVTELAARNQISVREALQPGQKLLIHAKEIKKQLQDAESKLLKQLKSHIVEAGDTLYSISKRYNIPVASLKEWNNKKDSILVIGEKLKITAP